MARGVRGDGTGRRNCAGCSLLLIDRSRPGSRRWCSWIEAATATSGALPQEAPALAVAGLDKPTLVGEHDGLHAVAQAKLAEKVRDVRLHRSFAEVQLCRELGVALSGGKKPKHLELALRELAEADGFRRGRTLCVILDEASGDRRGEQCVSAGDDANRVNQVLRRRVLQHEAARTRTQRGEHVVVLLEGRQDDDATCYAFRDKAVCRL